MLYYSINICFLYNACMPTESVAVHTHWGHTFSGTINYRQHSSSTRSSWGARGTPSSCQDTGEAAHQSLSISFFLSFFFVLMGTWSEVYAWGSLVTGLSCCWIILFAKKRSRKEIKESFCALTSDNITDGEKRNIKMHASIQWQRSWPSCLFRASAILALSSGYLPREMPPQDPPF